MTNTLRDTILQDSPRDSDTSTCTKYTANETPLTITQTLLTGYNNIQASAIL